MIVAGRQEQYPAVIFTGQGLSVTFSHLASFCFCCLVEFYVLDGQLDQEDAIVVEDEAALSHMHCKKNRFIFLCLSLEVRAQCQP